MNVAWKLTWSYAVKHPTRMLLTSLAMVASACIVVWVVSGYDALASQFGEQATEYLGRYDFFVVPEDEKDATLDAELVGALRRDSAVAAATPQIQVPLKRLINPNANETGFSFSIGTNSKMPQGGPSSSDKRGQSGQPGQPGQPAQQGTSGGRPGASGGPGKPGGPGGQSGAVTLVGTDADTPPFRLDDKHKLLGHWIDPKKSDARDAVVMKTVAAPLNLNVGDEFLVVVGTKEFRLIVAGIVDSGESRAGASLARTRMTPSSAKPKTGVEAGPAASAVYVPLALAKHFTQDRAKTNLISVQLKPESKSQAAEFRKTWEKRLAKSRPLASIISEDDILAGMEEGMMGVRARQEAWAAAGLSLLAALFIIFTTLSMGVSERIRQFGMMRAVGLTRGQVAQVIAIEAMLLAVIGWAGGLLAGWGLIAVVHHVQANFFSNGASLGTWCIVLTGVSAVGGAFAASILPAWRAMRVEPLEAMSPQRSSLPSLTLTVAFGVIGLALIAVNPILLCLASGSSMSTDKIYYIYMAVGCTTMAIGFLLLTPAMIFLVEVLLGPLVARLLGIEPRLLRSQLGGNLWRTLGTTAALTVGLGLFVAMQIWGYSMLEPFKPGAWIPDLMVSFQSGGLPESEIDAVRRIPGVRADQCIPLAVEQPKLAADITDSEHQQSVLRQNNVILIGLDPRTAFGGSDPLLKLQFVEGSVPDAVRKLQEGRNCIVPDHFLHVTRLKVGDHFSMVLPDSPTRHVEYTIVGAVKLPGWHWMTKFSGLRRREGRSAAMVFADYATVKRDFSLGQVNFLWMNVDATYGQKHFAEAKKIADALEAAKRKAMAGRRGSSPNPSGGPPSQPTLVVKETFDAKRATVMLIGEELQKIAARHLGEKQPVNAQGQWAIGATMFGPSVRISTPDEVRAFIMVRASIMIWASCYLPLITLLVTSLGVVNTIMASVRARRWEFGVLRSQGVTRSGLTRMILAEGILIGLITCLLSLGFGVLSGWCGTGISQYVSFFGGMAPPLVIPWANLSLGFGMAMGLCLLAALWPAVLTGRAEPLKLLQAGRASL